MSSSLMSALYYELTQDATIAGACSTRVYPAVDIAENAAYPYLTFQLVGGDHVRHLVGGSGLVATRVQINCFSRSALDSATLGGAVRELFDNVTGFIGDPAGTPLYTNAVYLDNDFQDSEPSGDGSATSIHRFGLIFVFWHDESITP